VAIRPAGGRKFRDRDTGEERVKIMPAKNLDAISEEQIAAIRKLTQKGEKVLRRAQALEQQVIRMKQAYLAFEEAREPKKGNRRAAIWSIESARDGPARPSLQLSQESRPLTPSPRARLPRKMPT
jgi:hypothetical protein